MGKPATGQVAAHWPTGLSVGDRLCPLPTPPPIGHATGTVRCAANRQDRLDANYRRDPGRGADEGCSLVRRWMPAHGSRSAHTLLYLAAVRDDWCEHQPCRVRGPTRFQVCAAGVGAGHGVRGLDCLPTESGFWEWSSSVSARQVAMHELS